MGDGPPNALHVTPLSGCLDGCQTGRSKRARPLPWLRQRNELPWISGARGMFELPRT
jgi:hypothetical protein